MKEHVLLEKLNIVQPKIKKSFKSHLEDLMPILFLGNTITILGGMVNAAIFLLIGAISVSLGFTTVCFKVAGYIVVLILVELIFLAAQLFIINKKLSLRIY